MRAWLSSEVKGQIVSLSIHLLSYFMYVTSEGSGETGCTHSLVWAFDARRCDKYQILDNPIFASLYYSTIRSVQLNVVCNVPGPELQCLLKVKEDLG